MIKIGQKVNTPDYDSPDKMLTGQVVNINDGYYTIKLDQQWVDIGYPKMLFGVSIDEIEEEPCQNV